MPDPAPDNRITTPPVTGAANPQPDPAPRFQVSDANVDVDGVLTVLDAHAKFLEGLIKDTQAESAKEPMTEHLREIQSASEAVLRGELTLFQVQIVRESLEWAEKPSPGAWLPEAGPYIPARAAADEEHEKPSAKADKPVAVLSREDPLLEYWPELHGTIKEHADRIRGTIVPLNEANLHIPAERRELVLATLAGRRGISITPIEVGMKFRILSEDDGALFEQIGELDTTASRLARIRSDGVIHGLHGTDALTYTMLSGVRIGGAQGRLSMLGTPDEFYVDLHPDPELGNGQSAFDYAIPSSRGLQLLEALGLTPTDQERKLAELGVLLAVDAAGYLAFTEKSLPLLYVMDDCIVGLTPPPNEFIRPICCFKYNEDPFDVVLKKAIT